MQPISACQQPFHRVRRLVLAQQDRVFAILDDKGHGADAVFLLGASETADSGAVVSPPIHLLVARKLKAPMAGVSFTALIVSIMAVTLTPLHMTGPGMARGRKCRAFSYLQSVVSVLAGSSSGETGFRLPRPRATCPRRRQTCPGRR
jgi:hypothetical protein